MQVQGPDTTSVTAPREHTKPLPLTRAQRRQLADCERIISKGLRTFYEVGRALETIRGERLYRERYDTFSQYLDEQWGIKRATGYQYIESAKVVDQIVSASADIERPRYENQVRPLIKEPPEIQTVVWSRALERAENVDKITAPLIRGLLDEVKAEQAVGAEITDPSDSPAPTATPATADAETEGPGQAFEVHVTSQPAADGAADMLITLPVQLIGEKLRPYAVDVGLGRARYEQAVPLSVFGDRPPLDEILGAYRELDRAFKFNPTNEQVDWADFTWNPVTGCRHTCPYCYARHLANMRYAQGFQPTFHVGRLLAPEMHTAPDDVQHDRERNVFVSSMADLFGKWVPDWIIQAVLDAVDASPGWNYLFLTKFPQKLSRFTFPKNAWVGTTVDEQSRVALAEKHFREVKASVKWLSCEPMLERLTFSSLEMFDCVVIGAQEGYAKDVESKQPEWEWVLHLLQQAHQAGCQVYWKANLEVPKQLPRAASETMPAEADRSIPVSTGDGMSEEPAKLSSGIHLATGPSMGPTKVRATGPFITAPAPSQRKLR